jgi:hypothetical protein
MITVRVVQSTVDQVIDMITVWDCFVTAAGAVHVPLVVT